MPYQSTLAAHLFKNHTIVVTGGGSGIGRCTAHEIAALGGHVILIGRRESKLINTANEIKQDGGKASFYSLDIRDEAAVTTTIETLLKQHSRVHGLVNAAGGQYRASLADISKNGFEKVVQTNLIGGFLMSKTLFNAHFSHHGGAIVNITADNKNGMPGMGHSGAARAGVENLTQTAAWEWGPFGVRINAVAPGWVASSGLDTYPEAMQQAIRSLPHAVPLGRIASEAEISSVICFLLSRGGNFITGQTLFVDGGASMGSAPALYPLSHKGNLNSKTYNGFHRSITPDVLR